MALTVTITRSMMDGTSRLVVGNIFFDSSYNTGGEAFTPTLLGMYFLNSVDVFPGGTNGTHVYVPSWNGAFQAGSTIKVFQGDNANASAAQLVEVTAATDLSSLFCSFEARGS